MQFFITLSLLVAAATAYLVYQYRSRAFVADDAHGAAPEQPAQQEPADSTLRAA
jgi:hypothetical protein